MNAVNFALLEPMSSAISLMNIVETTLLRHHLSFFSAMVGKYTLALDNVTHPCDLIRCPYAIVCTAPPTPQDTVAQNSGLNSLSCQPYATPVARLSYELDMFELEYQAMLYGGNVRSNFPYMLTTLTLHGVALCHAMTAVCWQ